MSDDEQLRFLWTATQARLPEGWTLDGLRCASTGLSPAERSDDWVAVALGPGGEERAVRGGSVAKALEALVANVSSGGTD